MCCKGISGRNCIKVDASTLNIQLFNDFKARLGQLFCLYVAHLNDRCKLAQLYAQTAAVIVSQMP